MSARIGVITFPGSLDDGDAQRAIRLAGAEPVALWHGSHDLDGVVVADAQVGEILFGDQLAQCAHAGEHNPAARQKTDRIGRKRALFATGEQNQRKTLWPRTLLSFRTHS